jgi:hypothetical protein
MLDDENDIRPLTQLGDESFRLAAIVESSDDAIVGRTRAGHKDAL